MNFPRAVPSTPALIRGPKVCESSSSLVITPPGAASVAVRRSFVKWMCEPPTMAPSDRPVKLMRVGSTPTGPAGAGVPGAIARPGIDFVSWMRSASAWRRLSRPVAGLVRLMKCVPEASTLPSRGAAPVVLLTRSTSKVRSVAPMHCGSVGEQYSAPNVGSPCTIPCSGRSIATTMKQASA